MSPKHFYALFLMISTLTHAPKAAAEPSPADQCRFIGVRKFKNFTTLPSSNSNETVLLSPVIAAPAVAEGGTAAHGGMALTSGPKPAIDWNELIVSWNAETPSESWLKVEAKAIYPDHQTKFYTMGVWSKDSTDHPKESIRRQRDADGTVNSDTLVMNRSGGDVQLRVTLGGPNAATQPRLKFLGLSFLDTNITISALEPRRAVWGKIVSTTERSQHNYPQEKGWCSPTSLSMVLTRWGDLLHRPEMTLDVPGVAAAVYDPGFGGTGNWPFNTAYAGSFPGMRAYISRFSDLSEVEDWIAAGMPVILSARWDLLAPGRKPTGSGHLVVCIGFTKDGDVVINDPATNLQKGQKVRHIYTRDNVIAAWKESHNTVYLIYPEKARIPSDRFGHWDKR